MSASDKSLTKDEIRARYFERDLPIDRHGNYMERIGAQDQGRTGFCALLHYHLIEGMSDKDALAKMKLYEMSAIEANFTLKRAKEFISDVLEIDLDDIRKNMKSTARYIYEDVQKMLQELDHRYEDQRHGFIEFEGCHFQADENSRSILGQYIQANHAPEYWLDTTNTRIEPFSVEQCQALLAAIVQRDQELHATMSDAKKQIRVLAEARDFTGLKALQEQLGM
ncbi:hypothetical protein MLDJOKPK_00279 [Salmonella phage SPAsTU]|nr:protein of unknown function DUF4376 [Salmonella phage STsAS]AWN09171.1 hypothetical protein MLDJOKPK_00279 [Salmonella phage SPAsTU]